MEKEKVLLVVVVEKQKREWTAEEIGVEMEEVVNACGGRVVECVYCRQERLSAAYLINSGKVQEIAEMCALQPIDTVVFSYDLKGSQQRNLEEVLKTKTIDRTQLILDIFAKHASSMEGKMQVELAQLEYLRPRLVGKGIALSRLGGGIGTSGPGETKLEMDRRRIDQRIAHLRRELKEVEASRSVKRKRRQDQAVPLISLVGYTNAGKSTLLNALTQAEQVTRDGLFTTLDSLARQYILPNHQKVILSDTVGFMHDLPHHLIESFKTTLEEVRQSDLLIHVLDISQAKYRLHYEAVLHVLAELGVMEKPVITVLNKIDKLQDRSWLAEMDKNIKNPVALSALTGEHLDDLAKKIEGMLCALIVNVTVIIPISRMDLVSRAHAEGQVYSVKYYNDRIHLRAALPKKLAGLIEKARVA